METERYLYIERRSYSAGPWRIIDSLTGFEVTRPVVFDHAELGQMVLQEAGFDTKAEAIKELGRMAARSLPGPQESK